MPRNMMSSLATAFFRVITSARVAVPDAKDMVVSFQFVAVWPRCDLMAALSSLQLLRAAS